ncbi:MAG TPA: ankyrin repeat domain-containing protein [Pyrinomonadaceae bacterium]
MSKTRVIEAVQRLDLPAVKQLLKAKSSLLTVKNRQGRNLLHLACCASCKKLGVAESAAARMVNHLLDLGMEIEEEGGSGRDLVTPLWFAVCFGRNITVVKLLIKRGAKPERAPGGGLYAAGWWEDTQILDVLIQAGAKVDMAVGVTPFLACWCWRRFESVKFLALKGANVDFQDPRNGKTALHYGVEREFDPALLKWLVKHGASPDIEDKEGVTPRLKASRKRDKRFFDALG